MADGLRTFYIEGVGFVSKTEVESSVDGLSDIHRTKPCYGLLLRCIPPHLPQAAENGKFGPDSKGNSVF